MNEREWGTHRPAGNGRWLMRGALAGLVVLTALGSLAPVPAQPVDAHSGPIIDGRRTTPDASDPVRWLLGVGSSDIERRLPGRPDAVEPRGAVAAAAVATYTAYVPIVLDQVGGASTTLSPETGGSAALPDGQATVSVPGGAVGSTSRLTVEPVSAPPPAGVSDFGQTVEIVATDAAGQPITTLAKPATLELSYAKLDLAGASESDLTIYRQASTGEWTPLATTVDTSRKLARSTVDHLSRFGLFGKPRSTGGIPTGIAVDTAGNVYWLDSYSFTIRRSTPGSLDSTVYYDLREVTRELSGGAGDLEFDPASGYFYFTDGNRVYGISPQLQGTAIYTRSFSSDSGAVPGDQVNGVGVHPSDGSLYVATKDAVHQVNPRTRAVIRTLRDAPTTPGGFDDVVVDSRGRIFAVATDRQRGSYAVRSWSNLYYWDDARTPRWQPVAFGFSGGRGLAADADGNVYVANLWGDALSIVSGDDPAVVGVIRGVRLPWDIAPAGNTLLVAGNGQLLTVPRSRRDVWSFTASTSFAGVSSAGSIVNVAFSPQDPIPAHHSLWIGGAVIHEIASVTTGTVAFQLPSVLTEPGYNWTLTGLRRRFSVPPGVMHASIASQSASFGSVALPGIGNWRPGPSRITAALTDQLAAGDWLVWSRDWEDDLVRVRSVEGAFSEWTTPSGGQWFAHQFTQPGTYHFEVKYDDGKAVILGVNVTWTGAAGARDVFQVPAAAGGKFHSRGVLVDIPPGALPGGLTYSLTVTSSVDTRNVTPRRMAYGYFDYRYQIGIQPQPTRLNKSITLLLPYDQGTGSAKPRAVFYDDGVGDVLRLDHRLDAGAHALKVEIEPGDFSPPESGAAPVVRTSARGRVRPMLDPGAARAFYGVKAGKGIWNVLSDGISWALEEGEDTWYSVSDDHFAVFYNTTDFANAAAGEQYARTALAGLSQGYDNVAQSRAGWLLPTDLIVVEIVPTVSYFPGGWSALGATGKWGKDGFWHIYLRSQTQNDEELKSTAAHEFFHVVEFANLTNRSRRFWAANWFLESAAVWAQYRAFGMTASTKTDIENAATFANKGLLDWGSTFGGLSSDEQYAAGAFVIHLVDQRGDQVVKQVIDRMNLTGTIASTALAATLKDDGLRTVYDSFARAFWLGTANPFTALSLPGTTVAFDQPSSLVYGTALPPLSSQLFQVGAADDTSKWPAGYAGASGGLIRYASDCNYGSAVVYDGRKQPTGIEFTGRTYTGTLDLTAVESTKTTLIDRLSTMPSKRPRNVLLVNAEPVAGHNCQLSVWFEAPTLTEAQRPAVLHGYNRVETLENNVSATLRLAGGGLGYRPGSVLTTHPAYPEIAVPPPPLLGAPNWKADGVLFDWAASHYSGTVGFSVRTAEGIVTNPVSVTIKHTSVITSVLTAGGGTVVPHEQPTQLTITGWFLEAPGKVALANYGPDGYTIVQPSGWTPTSITFTFPPSLPYEVSGRIPVRVLEANGQVSNAKEICLKASPDMCGG